jgi:hypothetical protein
MNAIKTTLLSWLLPKENHSTNFCSVQKMPSRATLSSRLQNEFANGKLDKQIEKAEIDYANGRAIDRLY